MCIYVDTDMCIYVFACTHFSLYLCVYIYAHACIHIYIYIYTLYIYTVTSRCQQWRRNLLLVNCGESLAKRCMTPSWQKTATFSLGRQLYASGGAAAQAAPPLSSRSTRMPSHGPMATSNRPRLGPVSPQTSRRYRVSKKRLWRKQTSLEPPVPPQGNIKGI